ncbi:hypothetical protein JCM11491_002855 [Sporobolomyces phaffii]
MDEHDPQTSLRHRREAAVRDPLMRFDRLALRGPTNRPDTIPDPAYPQNSSSSPAPPRPIIPDLLASDGPAHSDRGWELELIEPIQTGQNDWNEWSQVWQARALKAEAHGAPSGAVSVILKLYDEALFPYLEDKADEPSRDIPICYGFYDFSIRNNERVVGVILEDLTRIADTLPEYVALMKKRGEYSPRMVRSITVSAFQTLARLHAFDVADVSPGYNELFVLRAHEPENHYLVFIDFGDSETREDRERSVNENEQDLIQRFPEEDRHRFWLNLDHESLVGSLSSRFIEGEAFVEWCAAEEKERNFNLMTPIPVEHQ